MWELIDQYIYLYIVLCSFYIYLNKKSQYIAGILLVVLLLLSSSFFLNLILGPALFLLSIITIVIVLLENYEEFKELNYRNVIFYELMWAVIGAGLIIVTVINMFNVSFLKVINDLKGYDTLVFIYVLILCAKFIQSHILNKENNKRINQVENTNQKIENNNQVNRELIDSNEIGDTLVDNELNKQEIEVDEQKQINKLTNESSNSNNQVNPKRRNSGKEVNNFNVFLVSLVIILAGFSYFMIHRNIIKYDATIHMLPIYDHNTYNPEIQILAANEAYKKDGDYSKLYKKYEELGYSKEEIDAIFEGITSDELERVNKIDLNYEVSVSNVKAGDLVKITATYNEDKADKQKVKVINAETEILIDGVPEVATKDNVTMEMIDSLLADVDALLRDEKITYSQMKVNNVYLDESIANGDRKLIVEYKLTDGEYDALIGTRAVSNIYITAEVHLEDDKLIYADKLHMDRDDLNISDQFVKLNLSEDSNSSEVDEIN